ncbi:type II toxin-antitoxin system RelE/ParE family toxin [Pendulispora albinea]|uniref:Type II toxin-antitoxin system RelE/ParE family toxin n=1 Tax=Pendulispora albinea TaxID=2741071 RepID=A0ABZ2M321_9BACT
MKILLSPRAQRDLRAYLFYVAATADPMVAERERARIHRVLSDYASLPTDGRMIVLQSERGERRVHRWIAHPFHLYYERRGDVFYVVRLYHAARQPLERGPR